MDKEIFEAIIAKYGEENIIGIGFDNSSGVTFGETEQFSLAQHYKPDFNALSFIEYDMHRNPYTVLKNIGDIQAIMIKDSTIDICEYDRINIRG